MASRIVENVPDGARFVDSVDGWGIANNARAIAAAGYHGAFLYLEQLTPGMLDRTLAGGLGCCFFSYADDFDLARILRELRLCGVPSHPGPTIADDLESYHAGKVQCVRELVGVSRGRILSGYEDPGLYVGAEQPLDGAELGALPHTRYLASPSKIPMPTFAGIDRGWCWRQELPFNQHVAGVQVDVSRAGPDPLGRVLRWLIER